MNEIYRYPDDRFPTCTSQLTQVNLHAALCRFLPAGAAFCGTKPAELK